MPTGCIFRLKRHNTSVKRKTTIYVDENLLRAAKVRAAETGRKEYQVVEAALEEYLRRDRVPRLEALRSRRSELLDVAASHGARNIRIFGSVARGDAGADSDIDFLVDLEPGRTLLDLSALIVDFQELLGREVDVIEISQSNRVAERIMREAVPL